MITITNFGWRLGNQLFQIAAGAAQAEKMDTRLLIPEWKYQKYFKFKFDQYKGEPISLFHSEEGFHYSPIPEKKDIALSGYFQSEKYFKKIIDVNKLFEFNKDAIAPFEPVMFGITAVHVRRGDYLNYPDHHPLCTLEYYKKAFHRIPRKEFYVISDDTDWCRDNFTAENFPGCRFYFTSRINSDIHDFYQMTLCDNVIISNSTFSWWAAYLNKNPEKIIISPSKDNWHGSAYAHWNHDDLIPKEWIQIKF